MPTQIRQASNKQKGEHMKLSLKSGLTAMVVILASTAGGFAQSWVAGPDRIEGSIRAGSRDVPVKAGEKTQIAGSRLTPGQTIQVLRGTELLTPQPVTVDENGKFKAEFDVPADAEAGLHPLTVLAANPTGTALINLKLSKDVPLSGEDGFETTTTATTDRAYQMALSDDGKIFVASARGKAGPGLARFDAATLTEEAQAEVPNNSKGEPMGTFGVGFDAAHDTVWTTDTLNQTVVVYGAADLKPVKIFDEGTVGHPRDVLIDAATNRAYVNDALTGKVHVFDTESFAELDPLYFNTVAGREVFASMSLTLDAAQGRLYSVSRETPFVGWVDVKTGENGAFEVPGIAGGTGIARDADSGRLYVVSQDSDNLVVLDDAGQVVADTYIGAGGLSVAFDPTTKQVYAVTRAAGTVTVTDADGTIVANLPLGDAGNHVLTDGQGVVYALTMYGPRDDDDAAGSVTRFVAK